VSRPKSWFRAQLIVDRGLQFNLVTRVVIFVLFTFCVIFALLYSPLVRRLVVGQDPESRALAEILLYMQARFWPAALICLAVAVIGAVLTSHRIAGPLVRVKRILRLLSQGHFPAALHTRPGDYFRSEVDVLNEMVSGLSKRVHDLKTANTELNQALSTYTSLVADSQDHEVRESLRDVRQKAEAEQLLLDEFTVQRDPVQEERIQPQPVAEPTAVITPCAAD
jgi:methyl-accepting chemotaxis protein